MGSRDRIKKCVSLRFKRAARRRCQRHSRPQCGEESPRDSDKWPVTRKKLEMETRNADPADVASIDAIITAAYDSISGPPGKRDWDRERSLFIPGARLIPTSENGSEPNPGRENAPHMLDVNGFNARVRDYASQTGLFDTEITPRRAQLE